MEITKTSIHSGITRTLTLDVTAEEIANWKAGELIQVAMPRLNADEREFIKTGITSQEWEQKAVESMDSEPATCHKKSHPDS